MSYCPKCGSAFGGSIQGEPFCGGCGARRTTTLALVGVANQAVQAYEVPRPAVPSMEHGAIAHHECPILSIAAAALALTTMLVGVVAIGRLTSITAVAGWLLLASASLWVVATVKDIKGATGRPYHGNLTTLSVAHIGLYVMLLILGALIPISKELAYFAAVMGLIVPPAFVLGREHILTGSARPTSATTKQLLWVCRFFVAVLILFVVMGVMQGMSKG